MSVCLPRSPGELPGGVMWSQWWRTRLPMQETQEMLDPPANAGDARDAGPLGPNKNPRVLLALITLTQGQEDPREEEMAAPSSILAWATPWAEEPGGLQSMRSQRVGRG